MILRGNVVALCDTPRHWSVEADVTRAGNSCRWAPT